MLTLYAARENIDKERFIYGNIAGETLVIVPDQYTLVAEEQALKYMETECLFDVEILSMNRLGMRVLTEKGTESVTMLDKYGRFMLLTKLIGEHLDDFDIFRRSAGKMTFTQMLSDFISEFKQQDCTLDEVQEMLEGEETDPLLRAKLSELSGVIEAYTAATEGKYTDSEDYISEYVNAIQDSQLVRGKAIWIYGYDSITPKFTNAVLELAAAAGEVNFIVNRTDFDLDEQMTAMLMKMGAEAGIPVRLMEIGREYELPKTETIRRIERGLWNNALTAEEQQANSEFIPEDLTMVCAANPYYEAESAASYIWHLIRDLGYRMRDIQIIANDESMMQPIIRRVFEEYGLSVFMDSTRDITDTPAVGFIVSLLQFVVHRRSTQDLFAMLKTGLAGVDEGLIEDLENYARNYHIRGTMWDKDFRYGEEAVGSEQFAQLNKVRTSIMSRVSGLDEISGAATIEEFVPAFRDYLNDVWDLEEGVRKASEEEEEMGLHDEAQRNVQSCRKALEILDQIVEIMGDSAMDLAEFTEIYTAGLTNIEVGVIPPTVDGLSVGTMIRTRPRPIRAAVILGANEGTLPLSPSTEGLFSIDEKEFFRQQGFALGSIDDVKMNEENAAMYRMLSKPSDKLYISWSMSDAEGDDASPSMIIDALRALFPKIDANGLIWKDIISSGWGRNLINVPEESLRHLMNRIKDRNAPAKADALTSALIKWYEDNRTEELDEMLKAAADENDPRPLGREISQRLFGRSDGTLRLSASSLGSYFDCPFKYYVDRGLRPREEREFSGDSRSVGDAYHECLMTIARRIISDRELLETVAGDDDALERLVSEELDRIAEVYRGGVFVSTGSEDYRMSRIKEICAGAVRAMAKQLASGSIVDASFEESFGRGGKFSPIRFKVGEDEVLVEGKIDRADVLDVEGDNRVRIVDYKTGSDKLDLWKMRNGYKMQLMIYLISATSGDMEPAGMFYFNIRDHLENIDKESPKKQAEIMERSPEDIYKLKGRYIDEPGVLGSMPAEMLAGSKNSISREEYEEVRNDVLSQIEKTATGILAGDIRIRPFKENGKLVCNFCSYRPICRRDREYMRNMGFEIPKKPQDKKDDGEKE
ncbi:MAG: PD-(D/E)XK nuclease family protein [Mogibacterium sp.]|nr:PD-(D/E)XK nuclease family protein [Mogibacterium sp.]